MSVSKPHHEHAPLRTLATAGLPRRVRRTLERALSLVSEELDPALGVLLNEFEQELFRLADLARNPGSESGYMQTLRTFRMNRADLVPQFMLELEASLCAIRRPAAAPAPVSATNASFHSLSLVEEAVMDEDTVLREIASRQEGRANLPLHLLGQRFGVLAGSPAFDAERIPLGPQALCRAMRNAGKALQISHDSRLLLYRLFDRHVMVLFARVLEKLDALLASEGILPGLTYVPMRARAPGTAPPLAPQAGAGDDGTGTAASGAEGAGGSGSAGGAGSGGGGGTGGGGGPGNGSGHGERRGGSTGYGPAPSWAAGADGAKGGGRMAQDPQRPHTGWMGEATSVLDEGDEAASYAKLQQLMSGRRELLGKLRPTNPGDIGAQLTTHDLVGALAALQMQPQSPTGSARSLMEIKQTLLAQARQKHGQHAALSDSDSDTFELLHMLYGQLESETRSDAPSAALIRRLQVPLLRVALQDPAFFVRGQHPARQLLNTVAESGAKWLDADDFDPQLLLPLQQAVSHVVEHYDGDSAVFEASNQQLQGHMQAQVRKAEMLERRHVEAARGKEKLEVAKRRANRTLVEICGDQRLPKFSRALLNQAWADVLTLTLLRQGEESEEWRQQVDATRRIVAACGRSDAAPDPALATHIEAALAQVGYHGDEAAVIAQRLTSGRGDDDGDPASRTELAMKLKARTRLGEDAAKARRPVLPPRTPDEQARYEQLRVIPFGTWIEFVINQQGDVVRRRLSWFSPLTDNALFVNQRGQRVGEHSLDTLARMLAGNQARIVTADRGRLVDRAWQAAMGALRSFAGRGDGMALPEAAR